MSGAAMPVSLTTMTSQAKSCLASGLRMNSYKLVLPRSSSPSSKKMTLSGKLPCSRMIASTPSM